MSDMNGQPRTHEPNLRETVLLHDALEEKLDALDRLLNGRLDAIDSAWRAALEAHRALNEAREIATEKAITKAEQAQSAYNIVHNDLARKMEGQYAMMLPRSEAELRFQVIADAMGQLRETQSEGQGRREGITTTWGFIIAVAGVAAGIGGIIVRMTLR